MNGALKLIVAGLAAGLVTVSPVAASPETDAFSEACLQNPTFFEFAVDNLDQQPAAHSTLCTCLVDEFADYPEADIVMLTKDMDDTATAEDRTAYGDYTALEAKARDGLEVCLATAGLVGDEPAPPTEAADMTSFDASCQSSQGLLEVIGGSPEQAEPHRATLCACLSTEFAPRITTADATVLGQDLDNTATEDSRNAHPGYKELTELAGGVFTQCFEALELPATQ